MYTFLFETELNTVTSHILVLIPFIVTTNYDTCMGVVNILYTIIMEGIYSVFNICWN